MSKGTLQVDVFDASASPPGPLREHRPASVGDVARHDPSPLAFPARARSKRGATQNLNRGRFASSILCLCASLALHFLLLGSLLGGFAQHSPTKHSDSLGNPDGQSSAGGDPALEWVDIPISAAPQQLADPELPVLTPLASLDLPAPRIPPELFREPRFELPTETEAESAAGNTPTQDPGKSRLYGLYVGQINARIERAWSLPRESAGATFVCSVRVDQEKDGSVESVTLEECNGDTRWQSSLVHAIEAASPLPAPPDDSVFARTIRLRFEAQPEKDR